MRVETGRLSRQISADLDLTPLIDAVFLLLIFFAVSSTFVTSRTNIEVDLPEASSGTPVEPRESEIVIDAEGAIFLDGAQIAIEDLEATVSALKEATPDIGLRLNADRQVPYEIVVAVMDRCRRAGVENFLLGTVRPPGN